jgi:putative transposase
MTESLRLLFRTILRVAADVVSLISQAMRSRAQLEAENLFLRKQLALYLERQVKPRRADDATRITLVALSRFVEWRRLLTIVKPDTLIRWHRKGEGCTNPRFVTVRTVPTTRCQRAEA